MSVKSHLSLLFREIPIVFKNKIIINRYGGKKICTKKVKYLNSKFNKAAFKEPLEHLQEQKKKSATINVICGVKACSCVAQFRVGGIYLVIHFVESSKYDVITAAQGYEHDRNRLLLL